MTDAIETNLPWPFIIAGLLVVGALGFWLLSAAEPPPPLPPARTVVTTLPDLGDWEPFPDLGAPDLGTTDTGADAWTD